MEHPQATISAGSASLTVTLDDIFILASPLRGDLCGYITLIHPLLANVLPQIKI